MTNCNSGEPFRIPSINKWYPFHIPTSNKPNYALKHTYHVPTPRYGQYLMHAHNHITPAVAAMDSCVTLIGAHQRGITVRSMSGEKIRVPKTLNCRGECKAFL